MPNKLKGRKVYQEQYRYVMHKKIKININHPFLTFFFGENHIAHTLRGNQKFKFNSKFYCKYAKDLVLEIIQLLINLLF